MTVSYVHYIMVDDSVDPVTDFERKGIVIEEPPEHDEEEVFTFISEWAKGHLLSDCRWKVFVEGDEDAGSAIGQRLKERLLRDHVR